MKTTEKIKYNKMVFALGVITLLLMLLSCDSQKRTDEPQPNYTPYAQITITQVGDMLTVNAHADCYYWYNWDAHINRIAIGMTLEQSLRQPNEWTTDNRVTWTKKCPVRVGCMKDGNISWSDIKQIK